MNIYSLFYKKGITNITIKESSRRRSSWALRKKQGRFELNIPAIFSNYPDHFKEVLVEWASILILSDFTPQKELRAKKKELQAKLKNYLPQENHLPTLSEKRIKSFKTRGKYYNLLEIFNFINDLFFNGNIKSYLNWGGKNSRTSFHKPYTMSNGKKVHVITISGIYDKKSVPLFVIRSVMYHEMLHIAVPPYYKNGRKVIHGKEFKEMEKKIPWYKEWQEWKHKVSRY